MAFTNSLNSKPLFPLSTKVSETTAWKHTSDVEDPHSRNQSLWVCELLRTLTRVWLPSCYNLCHLWLP